MRISFRSPSRRVEVENDRGFAFDPLAGEEASTLGRPHEIAVKAINHDGDEVMKVVVHGA